jgi:hypothetical protein
MENQPKLSNRAQQALDLLSNGGELTYLLERNSFTGREQFQTRFKIRGSAVKGLGHATRHELERAGFRFKTVHRYSTGEIMKLDHAA